MVTKQALRAFSAGFPDTCASCDGDIDPGDKMVITPEGEKLHKDCAEKEGYTTHERF